jgi:hypothetical protein
MQFLRSFLCCLALLTPPASYAANAQESCRSVGEDWVWFSDHVSWTVDYFVFGPKDRVYEIGTGLSINQSVWGRTQRGQNFVEVTAYGIGALHVRRLDQGEDFEVCVGTLKLEVLMLCSHKYGKFNICPSF